jgi:hypothetical protein
VRLDGQPTRRQFKMPHAGNPPVWAIDSDEAEEVITLLPRRGKIRSESRKANPVGRFSADHVWPPLR